MRLTRTKFIPPFNSSWFGLGFNLYFMALEGEKHLIVIVGVVVTFFLFSMRLNRANGVYISGNDRNQMHLANR